MDRFDKVMELHQNYDTYCHLCSEIKSDSLVCYVGTGLSLFSKSWGEPFGWIIEQLLMLCNTNESEPESYLEDFINTANKKKLKKLQSKLRETTIDYPAIGDKLEDIISTIHPNSNRWPNTFNGWFIKALKHFEALGRYKDPEKQSVYLVPYIGRGICITTNCDSTFDSVYQSDYKTCCIDGTEDLLDNWCKAVKDKKESNCIFYIHGYVKKPGSLIMTKHAYEKAYRSDNMILSSILSQALQSYTILFLGASLVSDETVKNFAKTPQQSAPEKYHVAFFRPDEITNMSSQLSAFNTYGLWLDHNNYTTILKQLIRDTSVNQSDSCKWIESTLNPNRSKEVITPDYISKFLDKKSSFACLEVNDTSFEKIHRELTDDILYAVAKNYIPIWAICLVQSAKFILYPNEHELNPSFDNRPLFNTIYFIDVGKVGKEAATSIIYGIKSWEKSNRNNFNPPIKVRVIAFYSNEMASKLKNNTAVLESEIVKANNEIAKLKNRNGVLENELAKGNNEIAKLKNENIVLENELAKGNNEVVEFEKRVAEIKIVLSELKLFLVQLEETNREIELSRDQVKKRNEQIKMIFTAISVICSNNDLPKAMHLADILTKILELLLLILKTKVSQLGELDPALEQNRSFILTKELYHNQYGNRKDDSQS